MDFSFQILMKLIFFTFPSFLSTQAQEFNFGLCADPICSEVVGHGHTLQHYTAPDHFKLSFTPNEKVQIIVKDAGHKKDLLGVLKGGKKGYVPKILVREDITYKRIEDLVPAQINFLHPSAVSNDVPSPAHSSSHIIPTESQLLPSEDYSAQEGQYYNSNPNSFSQHSGNLAPNEYSPLHTQGYLHSSSDTMQPQFGYPSENIAQEHFNTHGIHNIDQQHLNTHGMQNIAQQHLNTHGIQNTNFEHASQYNFESNNIPHSSFANGMLQGNGQQQPYLQPSDSTEFAYRTDTNYQDSNIQSNHMSTPQFGLNHGLESTHVTNTHSSAVLPSQVSGMQPPVVYHSHHFQNPALVANIKHNVKVPYQELINTIALLESQDDIDSITGQYATEKRNGQFNVQPSPSQNIDISGASGTNYDHQSSSQFHSFQIRNHEATLQESGSFHQAIHNEGKLADSNEVNSVDIDYESDASYRSSNAIQSTVSEEKNGNGEYAYEEEDDDDEVEIEEEEKISLSTQETNAKKLEKAFNFVGDSLSKKENVIDLEKDLAKSEKNPSNGYSLEQPKSQNVDEQESISQSSQFVNKEHASTSKSLSPLNDEESPDKLNVSKLSIDSFDKNSIKYASEDNITYKSEVNDTISAASDLPVITQRIDSNEDTESVDTVSYNNITESSHVINAETIEIIPDTSIHSIDIEYSKSVAFSHDGTEETDNITGTDLELPMGQESELDKILNISELSESEKVGYLNPYQIRNLKEENGVKENENIELDEIVEDANTYAEFNLYETLQNTLEAIRTFIKLLMPWVPEPLYSVIMDLHNKGISPHVPVFTTIISIPCVLLIIAVVYIREKSKEKELIGQLALSEKSVYVLSAEKNILEEKIEKVIVELQASNSALDEERSTFKDLKTEIRNLKEDIENANLKLERKAEEIETLKEREKQYTELISDYEKTHAILMDEKNEVEQKLLDIENTVSNLTLQYEDKEKEFDELFKEKLKYIQLNENYEEKLSQLQQNCNQLLKEAEVWNMRVNDLTVKLTEEMSAKEDLETSLTLKDNEIETLTHLVQTFKSFEEFKDTGENEIKSDKDKLQSLMDSARLLIKLQKQEDENKVLSEKLSCEKNRILDMEVEFMDAKSEIDKLKVNYNQALQDKAEAQTKLDVLTNYFKDKEIQLQKQLGVHEAVREKREKDADSAERRIILIEQENTSYKYQVASMKQEMEETERNLKSQIASQEKKAHENWIAARAAERKLEDMKQEVTQLRQRLTLLEREQEKWANSSRDEIIRPVPKRLNDESVTSHDMNNSMDMPHMFPPPHHMMLPPDRPLPPLPPPPHLPPFLPPPPLEPHFRHQPWPPLPPDSMSGSEFRITPPDFSRGRESTPPRGHHSTLIDGEMGPRQSSPLGGEMRDSRNSTPPHSLPDFHDIPPPPRPFFQPPGIHPRYPLPPPPFRRDMPQGPRRTENQGENGTRGSQQAPALSENWPQSNSRV